MIRNISYDAHNLIITEASDVHQYLISLNNIPTPLQIKAKELIASSEIDLYKIQQQLGAFVHLGKTGGSTL